jgi:hypothetical protein
MTSSEHASERITNYICVRSKTIAEGGIRRSVPIAEIGRKTKKFDDPLEVGSPKNAEDGAKVGRAALECRSSNNAPYANLSGRHAIENPLPSSAWRR